MVSIRSVREISGMKSIQYQSARRVACEEKAVPEVGPGEVLIKVAYAE